MTCKCIANKCPYLYIDDDGNCQCDNAGLDCPYTKDSEEKGSENDE